MDNVKKGVLNKWPFDQVLVNDAPNLATCSMRCCNLIYVHIIIILIIIIIIIIIPNNKVFLDGYGMPSPRRAEYDLD